MCAKKKEKEVEYKITEVFDLFPDIKYTRYQRMRFVLFHCYANNVVKFIRYAQHFDEPNKICLIYVVGHPSVKKIENTLVSSGCSDRVCVMCSDFPLEERKFYDEFDTWRKELKARHEWDDEADEPNEAWYQLVEKNKRLYMKYPDNMQYYVDCDNKGLALYQRYTELKRLCVETYFSSFTCYRIGKQPIKIAVDSNAPIGSDSVISDTDLLLWAKDDSDRMIAECLKSGKTQREIAETLGVSAVAVHKRIKKMNERHDKSDVYDLRSLVLSVYPYGVEAQKINEYSSFAPSSIRCGIEYGGFDQANKRLGFVLKENLYPVRAIIKLLESKIEEKGYCSTDELRDFLWGPPFGFRYDGYAAAILSRSLRKLIFSRSLLYYDGCNTYQIREMGPLERVIFDALNPPLRHAKLMCLFLESKPHKIVKQFMSKLWGIKIEMPGSWMGIHLATTLCKTHRVPLAYVDERLLKMTLWNVNFWDKSEMENLSLEIALHGDEILQAYQRYKLINSTVPDTVMSFLKADFSWMWTMETYEEILWESENYGAWPYDLETQRKILEDKRSRQRGIKDV